LQGQLASVKDNNRFSDFIVSDESRTLESRTFINSSGSNSDLKILLPGYELGEEFWIFANQKGTYVGTAGQVINNQEAKKFTLSSYTSEVLYPTTDVANTGKLTINNLPTGMKVRLIALNEKGAMYDFTTHLGSGTEAKKTGPYKIIFIDDKSNNSTQFYKAGKKNVFKAEDATTITIAESATTVVSLVGSNFIKGKGNFATKRITFHVYQGTRYLDLKYGDVLGELPNAKRAGYKFLGYYTKKVGGVKATKKTKVSAAYVYYARYKANNVKVTFNANGGKVADATKKVPKNTILIPTKAKITYTKPFESKLGKLPIPVLKYKNFAGWYTKQKGGKKVTAKTKVPLKKVTYYARWK
jgi:hypothetical protein